MNETTTNWNLLNWCIVVFVELIVLAALIPFAPIVLLAVILINPVRAALAWREPIVPNKDDEKKKPTPNQTTE